MNRWIAMAGLVLLAGIAVARLGATIAADDSNTLCLLPVLACHAGASVARVACYRDRIGGKTGNVYAPL